MGEYTERFIIMILYCNMYIYRLAIFSWQQGPRPPKKIFEGMDVQGTLSGPDFRFYGIARRLSIKSTS